MATTYKALYGTEEGDWMQIEFTEGIIPAEFIRLSVGGAPRLIFFVSRLIHGNPEANREHPAVQAWLKHRAEEHQKKLKQEDAH